MRGMSSFRRNSPLNSRIDPTPRVLGLLAATMLLMMMPVRGLGQGPANADTEIEISLENMGIEGSFRPGSYVPVRVNLSNRMDAPTPIQIVFEVPNNDGDIEQYSRAAVLSPGQTTSKWLYPVLGPSSDASALVRQAFTIRIYEDDGGNFGREIASRMVDAAGANTTGKPVEMTEDMLVIVGSGSLGLNAYEGINSAKDPLPSLNQQTAVINTSPQGLPDDSRGYVGIDAIVWSNANPAELGLETARALRTWIQQGGRLVILLSESGDLWGLGGQARSALSDLLPKSPPKQFRDVSVQDILPVLSKSDQLRNPSAKMSLRLFDENTLEPPWEPFAALPAPRDFNGMLRENDSKGTAGGLYAIQRRLGFGWIVLSGIDADAIQRRQLQSDSLPQADVFWNRLLGRRGALPTGTQIGAYEKSKQLRTENIFFNMGSGEMIQEFSSLKVGGGAAGTWTLFVLVLFIIYGILAGPLSYYYLKRKGQVRYSWMAFSCFALIFTVIAVIASTLGRRIISSGAPVSHLTFLDVVDGEETVRAQSWFSAYLERYGSTEVMVEGEDNLISTWSAPPNGSMERFPNSDVFRVPHERTNQINIPSRGTSAHFTTLWSGKLSGDWVDMPNDAGGKIVQSVFPKDEGAFDLSGTLAHGLPWRFSRIRIIQISPFITPLPKYRSFENVSREFPMAPLPSPGSFIAIPPQSWETGKSLDLSSALGGRQTIRNGKNSNELSLTKELANNYTKGLRTEGVLGFKQQNWRDHQSEILEMYSLYDMLPQRSYLLDETGIPNNAAGIYRKRWMARESDCSDWFLQPCLMVIGILEGVPSPIPIRIDGNVVESNGTVVLRWIHPLPVDGDLLRPIPRTLQSFEYPKPEVDGS